MKSKNKTLLLLTGVSGAGKSYLETLLTESGFLRCVTSTTRTIREGEKDGVSYHFKDDAFFEKAMAEGTLIESAIVNGKRYGMANSTLDDLSESSNNLYIILDPQGVKTYQDYFENSKEWNVVTVFLDCPLELRKERLMGRVNKDSSFDKKVEVATRLHQTVEIESSFKDMVTYDLYFEALRTLDDSKNAVSTIHELISDPDKFAPYKKIRDIDPVSFKPNKDDTTRSINKTIKLML